MLFLFNKAHKYKILIIDVQFGCTIEHLCRAERIWIHVTVLLIFSRWLNPLFKIGDEQKLKQDDMYSVLPEDRSQHLGEELQG